MFERLSVPARQAIVVAHEQAQGAGRKTISGADLMVGLLQVDGVTAGTVLRTYEFDTGEVDHDDDPDDFSVWSWRQRPATPLPADPA